ncbi:MAG: replicative DNA helicase [Bernardetiaceae bacterium]
MNKKDTKDNNRLRAPLNPSQAQTQLGRLPPQALDLEEAVLGALMIEKDALDQVVDILKPESFYKEAHQLVYQAILTLFNEGTPIDLLTVTEQLRKTGDLQRVGGAYAVTELTNKINASAHLSTHARIVSEKYIRREMIQTTIDVQREAYEDRTDVFDLLDRAQKRLFDIAEVNVRKNYVDMKSILQEAIKELQNKKDHKDGLTGVGTGFPSLDRVTAGWQNSDLIIIAARPGMGKTSFILSAVRNAAVEFEKSVAVFSLEMSALQLAMRLISSESEIESNKIKNGKLADYEWEQLLQKTDRLAEAKIFIDDTASISILEVRAKCRRLKAQYGIDLVVIDYLQLMSGDSGKGGNREQEIAGISRSLKQLAKELNIPVIALAQLSRAVETRGGDKKPMLSDLRESGSIEQDSDQVLFLYRPEYYEITQDEEGNPTKDCADVIIAKNRHGALETIRLKFEGRYTKFKDWEDAGSGFTAGSYDFPALPADAGNDFMMGSADDVMTFDSSINRDTPPPANPDDVPF